MKEQEIKKLELALGFKREIVGIKFIFIQEEYENIPVKEMEKRNTFCGLTARAMNGELLKAKVDCFTCQGGPEMLGMKTVSNYVKSGKQFATFRLYEDMAVAREVQNELCFVDQKIYGIVVGPLKKMEDADVAMFVCSAWQGMRVIQGYTYHYGMERYPFELSGGLCQRIVIAMAVICQPELIIADEPTTALDVTTQAEILCLLKETAKKIGSSVLIITHDLGVVAECADRVVVMYGGKLMEQGNVEEFFSHSKHPYSKGLLVSRPMNFNGRYPVIPGNITRNVNTIDGCPFAERCKHAQDICKKEFPKEQIISEEHKVWCWNTESEVV